MENENLESQKSVEETTTQNDSTEEKQIEQQPADGTAQTTEVADDDKVELSKKELETLRKKAEDFEKMTQTKRGQKLLNKMKQPSDDDDVLEETTNAIDMDEVIRVAQETALKVVDSNNQEKLKENVSSAYDDWIKENQWADNDEIFNSIFQNIKETNSTKKEDIIAELDRAALLAHPALYAKNMEAKITKKVLLEQKNIDVGSGGSAPSVKKEDAVENNANAEDRRIADRFFGGDLEKYLKYKEKNN